MAFYEVEHVVNYEINDIYDLIIDIEKYSEFLPWCDSATIIERKDDTIIADLAISFKFFTEHYRSEVKIQPPKNGFAQVDASMVHGPFKYLSNQWVLRKVKKNVTCIKFMIDFKFKSALLEGMIGILFSKACEKMIDAFETRAKEIYGKGNNGSKSPKRSRSRTKNS